MLKYKNYAIKWSLSKKKNLNKYLLLEHVSITPHLLHAMVVILEFSKDVKNMRY